MVSLDYIAGYLDGEGSISVKKNGKGYHEVYVEIYNNHLRSLESIQEVIGGHIQIRTRSNPKWAESYTLTLRVKEQKALLYAIVDKLIIKKPQAEVLINLWEGVITREESIQLMKILNQRGKEGGLKS